MSDVARLIIEVDSRPLGRASTDMGKFVASSQKAEDAARDFGEAASQGGRRAEAGMTAAVRQARATASAMEGVGRSAQQSTRGIMAAAEATEAVNRTMSPAATNGMRNVAFQLSQVGQMGAVTGNYMQALSIQMPDLLMSFGTLGIVVGAASASLLPLIANMVQTSAAANDVQLTVTAIQPALEALSSAARSMGEAIGPALQVVAENFDRIVITAGVAATFFGGKLVAGFVAARLATVSLSGALTFLRGALLRTGVGALIVGAGELVYQFTRLVQATGSFGQALTLLGQVAAGVWAGMITAAQAIPPGLNAVWNSMKAGFLRALSEMSTSFHDFIWRIANGFKQVEGLEAVGDTLMGVADAASEASGVLMRASGDAAAASKAAANNARDLGRKGFEEARKAAEKLKVAVDESTVSLGGGGGAGGSGGGGGGGGSGGSLSDALEENKTRAQAFADALREAGYTAQEFGEQQAQTVVRGIDGVANAFGDFVAGGLRDFEDFAKSVWQSFQRLLSDMVALAARRQIMISLGIGGSVAGGAGMAAAGGLAGGGGGGLLGGVGNLLGIGGGIGGSILGSLPGLTAAGSLTAGSGFLGGVGQALGLGGMAGGGFTPLAVGANAAAAGGGLMATLGAVAPIALAVGGALWLMKGSEEIVGQGLRLQVNQNMTRAQEFTKTRSTSWRFGGGSYGTDFDDLEGEARAAIVEPLRAGLQGVRDLAAQIGMGGFAAPFEFGIDLKDEDANQQNIQKAIGDAIEAQAAAFFQGSNAGLRKEGETGVQALTRLSSALGGVNDLFTRLGKDLFSVTRDGAAAASQLVEAFGGVEQLAGALDTYYQEFFSDKEREALLYDQVNRQLQAVNLAMPDTRDAFRSLAEAQDLNTERGREVYTTLLSVSGAFAELNPVIEDTGQRIEDTGQRIEQTAEQLRRARGQEVDAGRRMVAANARSNLSAAEQALRAAFGAQSDIISQSAASAIDAVQSRMGARIGAARSRADAMRGIRDAIKDALTSREVSDVLDPGGNLRAASAYIRDVAAGRAGLDAERLQAAMDVVAQPSTDLFSSFTEYQREFQKNTAALREIEERTGGSASAAERTVREITESRDQQVRAIENARDTQLAALESQLNAILGVEGATLSVASAIGNYREAAAEAERARTTTEGGFQKGSFGAKLDAIYRDLLGRGVRTEGLEYYGAEYVAGMTLSMIRESILASAERARYLETGIPRFAGGGYTGNRPRSGGLDGQGGFMAMLHPRETVVDHTRADGGDMAAMRRELKEQRELLKQVQRDTERTRKRADQWTVDGLLTRTS